MAIVFHIDLNSFFASCEIAKDPSLKDKPLVVAGESNRSVISTASYKARELGIHSAMPLFQAKKICDNLIIVPVNMNLYRNISNQFFNIIKSYTNNYEVASIDECYIDVTDISINYQNIIELAKSIQNEVFSTLSIGCSIGIANNKFLAKMASNLKKPNGITILTKDNIKKYLWPMPVGAMHGIGKKTASKLNEVGIVTIEDLTIDENYTKIKNILGKNTIIYINRAKGIDTKKVDNSSEHLHSIGHSTTFPKDLIDIEEIKRYLLKLCIQVANRATKNELVSNNISVTFKYSREASVVRSMMIDEYTNDYKVIYETAALLLEKNLDDAPIRLVGVSLNNVIKINNVFYQLDLFNVQTDELEELIQDINTKNHIKLQKASDLIK